MEIGIQPFSAQKSRTFLAFSGSPFSRSKSSQHTKNAAVLYHLLLVTKFVMLMSPALLPKDSTGT